MKVTTLYPALKQLVMWIQIGVYDFCHLPLVMKKALDAEKQIYDDIYKHFKRMV